MANDSVDSNKVSQDVAALKDKDSLHTAMNDMRALKAKDNLDDPDGKKQTFQKDLAQITNSVDLKGLGLDGFHVTGYAEADKGHLQLFQAMKPGANQGDKPQVKIVDQDGNLYDVNGTKLTATKDSVKNVFAAAGNQSPASKDGAPAPAKIADNEVRTDASPAPAAVSTDNSFGAHGRKFDVSADGKAVYTAKHGDTYWAVARDLLTKPDGTVPSNTEIANQVKALAALNNKSDANKLMTNEQIILPITPPAPEAAPPPPAPEAAPPPPASEAAPPPPASETAPPPPAPETAPAPEVAPDTHVGINMELKATFDAIRPQNDVYNPLAPLGVWSDKATNAGYKKLDVKGTVTTDETDVNLKDGWFGWNVGRTGAKYVDVKDGNILKSRETTYDNAVSMKMEGPKGPIDLHGVTSVKTTLDAATGNYGTDVTAGDGVYHFVTDSTGKVRRANNPNGEVVVLDTPSQAVLASLNLGDQPAAAPDAVAQTTSGLTNIP